MPLPATGYASQHKSLRWDLDMLGNWNSLVRDADEDGSFTDLEGDNHTDGRRHNAANEIESNGLVSDPNFDREVISGGSPAASRYHQHRYDHAGNMTDQRSAAAVPVGSGLMAGLRMGYDAWNRLVTTEYTSPLGASDVSAYTYNALGWRTSKTVDASKGAYDGVMEQKRVFVYDASWRIIEEHVDVDFDTNPGADWVSQHFWGLRYIDDLVAKRVDRDADGDWSDASQWYFITDSQFSVVAVLDHAKSLYDRIEYDAYGVARHRPSGDANGDGLFNSYDLASFSSSGSIGDSGYHADWDLNFDGTVDSADTAILAAQGSRTTALPGGWISDPSSEVGPDNSIGYTGYVFNVERQDYLSRHRFYTAELGRWRQRDPAEYIDGQNVLCYTTSNPVGFSDPMGLGKTSTPNKKGAWDTGYYEVTYVCGNGPPKTESGYVKNAQTLKNRLANISSNCCIQSLEMSVHHVDNYIYTEDKNQRVCDSDLADAINLCPGGGGGGGGGKNKVELNACNSHGLACEIVQSNPGSLETTEIEYTTGKNSNIPGTDVDIPGVIVWVHHYAATRGEKGGGKGNDHTLGRP